jgi:cystathionine beta-lyase/cystathionine gamma-synthase
MNKILLAIQYFRFEHSICHPLMMHIAVPKEESEKYGFTDALVRFSVGIEDVEDLPAV